MLAKNGQANAQAQARAAAGPLRGEERIKNLGKNVTPNPRAIILKSGHDAVGDAADTDAEGSVIANLSNGLLGVGDQVEENLSELAGVAEDERKIGRSRKIYRDAVRTQ